jgi:hypothetical protein
MGASVGRDVSVNDRGDVNADTAARVAAAVGIPQRSSDGRSERFAYFADGDRFLVVAGAQEGDAVQLALAYGMAWAGERQFVLALPNKHATATRQRLPWLSEGRRPELWLHSGGSVERASALDRAGAVRALADRLQGWSPLEEFTAASTALHLGSNGGAVDVLIEWATRDIRLDAAHRQSERSWHCMGQRVLSIRRTRMGLRVLGGVHGRSDDRAPVTVELPAGRALPEAQLGKLQQAVEQAIARRLDPNGDLNRPDEHWLQAVLRRRPDLVGIEQTALREVPAWRPRDTTPAWRRGYVDLLGLDGHGDIRVLETKLATNDDALLVLQGLDYLTWAHAYRDALAGRLGASAHARLRLHLVVGADEDGRLGLSPYSSALLDALAEDVDWAVQGVRDWFGPGAEPTSEAPALRTVPVDWGSSTGRGDTRFRDESRRLVARWKAKTATLPGEARRPARYHGGGSAAEYDFCLPAEHAVANLLPEVRDAVLTLFTAEQIRWHRGVGNGPGNHLLSSQVQCVNALGGMLFDPARLQRAFGQLLDIAAVLPIEDDRFVTFEYVDETDVLREGRGGRRLRGAQSTSVDAAFRYRTSDGRVELALVEWKYTEEYRRGRPFDPVSDATRRQRYQHLWAAVDGPLRTDVVPFDDLLVEPFYQLMRQQLLAHEMEKRREKDAAVVRVLHVLPPANLAYQQSLTRPSHRAAGQTVDEVWQRMLKDSDRFRHIDPDVFLDPAVTSPEYRARYGVSSSSADTDRRAADGPPAHR